MSDLETEGLRSWFLTPLIVLYLAVQLGNLLLVARWFVLRRRGSLVPGISLACAMLILAITPAPVPWFAWPLAVLTDVFCLVIATGSARSWLSRRSAPKP